MINSSYYQNLRLDVLDMIPNQRFKRILEIGGGGFPTLQELGKRSGAELWGVDLVDNSVPDIQFIKGSIETSDVQCQLPRDSFDLVVANDVIEHLQDTEGFINLVHMILTKKGLLALSVPNIRQIRTLYHVFIKGSFPRQEAGLFDKTHLRWFCKRDIVRLLSDADFEIRDVYSVGRLVPEFLKRNSVSEFLGLQNLILVQKR